MTNPKKNGIIVSVFSFIIILCSLRTYGAEISYAEGITDGINVGVITFVGEIKKGDFDKVIEKYYYITDKNIYLRFVVSTKGGSLWEAMKIGKWLRTTNIEVFVPPGHECSSACIYILAGAKKRYVIGDIGIHRPYHVQDDNGKAGIKLKDAYKASKEFFDEMNVSPLLVEDMFSIEPENIKYLTPNEAKRYRIYDDDYVQKENFDLSMADMLGISRQKWMIYSKTARERCDNLRLGIHGEAARCFMNEIDRQLKSSK